MILLPLAREVLKHIRSVYSLDNIIFLIDIEVYNLYPEIKNFKEIGKSVILFEATEANKTIEKVVEVYDSLISLEADRGYTIIAIGGGITLDVAGFVASTFYRGVDCLFIPTTLLSMVDASFGGKNGVNFRGYKNLIGNIREAKEVILCREFLSTLKEREFSDGIAEMIKIGIIADSSIITDLEREEELLRNNIRRDNNVNNRVDVLEIWDSLIERAIQAKAEVVRQDPYEKGVRKVLNLGHTLAHAIEHSFVKYSHGEAVAIGIIFALNLSESNFKEQTENISILKERVVKIFKKFNLPVSLTLEFKDVERVKETLLDAMRKDKKRSGEKIDYILVENLEKVRIVSLPYNILKEKLCYLLQF